MDKGQLVRGFSWAIFIIVAQWLGTTVMAGESSQNNNAGNGSEEYKQLSRQQLDELNAKLREAMALYYDHSYRLALPLLEDVAAELDTIDVLFWLGKAAYKTRRPELAIEKFNEILRRDPNLLAVRVELATAYLQAGNTKSARSELVTLLESKTPEGLRQSAETMIARIDKANKRWFSTLRASIGTEYDDNINVGPEDSNITLPGGTGVSLLAPDTLRGWLVKSNVNGDLLYDFGERDNFVWRSRLRFLHNEYLDSPRDNFNYTRVDASSGLEYYSRELRGRLPFGFVDQRFSKEELSRGYYAAPNVEFKLNDKLEMLLGYRFDYENFVLDGTDPQDNTTHAVTVGPRFRFDAANINHVATLIGGYTVRDASAERFSFDEWSIAPTYFARFKTGTEVFLQARFQDRDYDSPALLFEAGGDRRDKRYTATAVVSQNFLKHFFVSANYTHIRNDSNTALFDFRKNLVGINFGMNMNF